MREVSDNQRAGTPRPYARALVPSLLGYQLAPAQLRARLVKEAHARAGTRAGAGMVPRAADLKLSTCRLHVDNAGGRQTVLSTLNLSVCWEFPESLLNASWVAPVRMLGVYNGTGRFWKNFGPASIRA